MPFSEILQGRNEQVNEQVMQVENEAEHIEANLLENIEREQQGQDFQMQSVSVHLPHQQDAIVQEQPQYEDPSFYQQRTAITDIQNQLLSSLWNGKDSKSMQRIKNKIQEFVSFYSGDVLTDDQCSIYEKLTTLSSKEEFLKMAMDQAEAKYRKLSEELSGFCQAYINSHNPYTSKGKQRLEMVKAIADGIKKDENGFRMEVAAIRNRIGSNLLEAEDILEFGTWESVLSEEKYNKVDNRVFQNPRRSFASHDVAEYLGIKDVVSNEKADIPSIFQLMNWGPPLHYSDEAKKQMMQIAVFDNIAGAVNHDASRIYAEYEERVLPDKTHYFEIKSVKVNDYENSFNSLFDANSMEGAVGKICNLAKLNYVDAVFFTSVMNTSFDEIKFFLRGTYMDQDAFDKSKERFDYVKKVLMDRYKEKGEALFEVPRNAASAISVTPKEYKDLASFGIDRLLNETDQVIENKIRESENRNDEIKIIKEKNRYGADLQQTDIDLSFVMGDDQEELPDINLEFDFDGLEIQEQEPVQENLQEEQNEQVREQQDNLRQEEIQNEEQIELEEAQDNEIHMVDGSILREKYHANKEDMKFVGMSYFARRKQLTSREIKAGQNFIKLGDSHGISFLRESLESLHSFFAEPILTLEEQNLTKTKLKSQDSLLFVRDKMRSSVEEYKKRANELRGQLTWYIANHRSESQKGKAWIDYLKSIEELLEKDVKSFSDEVDVITTNIAEEAEEVEKIIFGGNWSDILSFSRSVEGAKIKVFETGNGVSGSTAKYEYNGKQYFRKTEGENPTGNANNNVAAYRFARLFGCQDLFVETHRIREYNSTVIDESSNMVLEKDKKKDEKYGMIMEKAKGRELREYVLKNTIPYAFSDNAKKQISKLATIDFLLGQTDRKSDNVMAEVEKRVDGKGKEYCYIKSIQAIDSDQCLILYPQYRLKIDESISFSIQYDQMSYISADMYETLMSLDAETLKNTLKYLWVDLYSPDTMVPFAYQRGKLIEKTELEAVIELVIDRLGQAQRFWSEMYAQRGGEIFNLPKHGSGMMVRHCSERTGINFSKFLWDEKEGLDDIRTDN